MIATTVDWSMTTAAAGLVMGDGEELGGVSGAVVILVVDGGGRGEPEVGVGGL